MVLDDLGKSITKAITSLAGSASSTIDDKVLDGCLKEICTALLQADVNVKQVSGLRNGIKKRVNIEQLAAGLNKQRVIEKAIFDELCDMLDSGIDPKKVELKRAKDKTSVVMFVGLQGSGKTTTCTKYAYYHKKKGWKPSLVCAVSTEHVVFPMRSCTAELPCTHGGAPSLVCAVSTKRGALRIRPMHSCTATLP